MVKEEAVVIREFVKVTVSHLKDLLIALPALVPQTKEDERIFKNGMNEIAQLIYDIEHCESIRELGKYFDLQRIVEDYTLNDVKMLNSQINTAARRSIYRIDEAISDEAENQEI